MTELQMYISEAKSKALILHGFFLDKAIISETAVLTEVIYTGLWTGIFLHVYLYYERIAPLVFTCCRDH